jgi:hypothetical protein
VGFFNKQIVDAVASLGFEEADVKFTADGLEATFSNRCSPPATVIPPEAGDQLQSICVAGSCPLDENAACGAYPNGGFVEQPVVANATLVGNVTKVNETEAAPTAIWPVHCVAARDESGGATQTCSFASGTATESAAASSTSGGGVAAVKDNLSVVAQIAVAWVVAAASSGMLFAL